MKERINWINVAALTLIIASSFFFGAIVLGGWLASSARREIDVGFLAQTLISTVGVIIAIYVPWSQRQTQMEDARQNAQRELNRERALVQAMQVALFQPVETFRAHCEFLKGLVRAPHELRRTLPADVFERAPEFDQFRPSLHLLGPLGIRINLLVAQQDLARQMLPSLINTLDLKMTTEHKEAIFNRLNRGAEIATEVRNALQESSLNETPSAAHAAALRS